MLNGFAGVCQLDGAPLAAPTPDLVDAMAAALRHRRLHERRGFSDGPLALAAPALGGLASSADGQLAAVVDGFFANARELGGPPGAAAADLLVSCYQREGLDGLGRLDGAYAFVLWDRRAGRLVLGRDHAGARPLLVARPRPGLLLFASELKGLLAHPECPRAVDWLGTLARHALPLRSAPPGTGFIGIDSLPPAGLLVADTRAGTVATRLTWTLRFVPEEEAADDQRSDAALIAGYRDALAAAVAAATSDGVPAALFLSGGIDSVAIAALARADRPLTLTALNRSTLENGDATLARAAADHLGLANHQVVSRRDGALTPERWQALVWMCESSDCRGQHYLKAALARHAAELDAGLGVLLHGEGSDELIGADPRNWNDDREDATYEGYLAELATRQREELLTFDSLAVEREYGGRRVFGPGFLAASSGRALAGHPMRRRALYCLAGLDQDVLWRDDRLAAAHGLEARAPFLDRRLLDFIAAIPPRAYPVLYFRKHLLREALRPELPDALRLQPKIPFYAGASARHTTRMLADVLEAEGRALVRHALGPPDQHLVLAPGFVDTLLDDALRDPAAATIENVFAFVNLGLLERMAADVAGQARRAAQAGPPLLVLRSGDGRDLEAALAEDAGATLRLDRPLALAPGVELAHPAGRSPDPPLWVIVSDEVRYVIDGDDTRAWRDVLLRCDGQTALGQLLADLGLELAAVLDPLRLALELDVVRLGAAA